MTTTSAPRTFLLLSPVSSNASSDARQDLGGSPLNQAPCLNTSGRWAYQGIPEARLIVWPMTDMTQAREAAERASTARQHPIDVISIENDVWVEGRDIQFFSDALESALLPPEPLSAGKQRRLRVEVEKLEAFCMVVEAASKAADERALSAISQAASQALHAKFGSGSVTSAFTWLAGRQGHDTLTSVLTGETDISGAISIQQLREAVRLASEAEAIRESASAQGLRH